MPLHISAEGRIKQIKQYKLYYYANIKNQQQIKNETTTTKPMTASYTLVIITYYY